MEKHIQWSTRSGTKGVSLTGYAMKGSHRPPPRQYSIRGTCTNGLSGDATTSSSSVLELRSDKLDTANSRSTFSRPLTADVVLRPRRRLVSGVTKAFQACLARCDLICLDEADVAFSCSGLAPTTNTNSLAMELCRVKLLRVGAPVASCNSDHVHMSEQKRCTSGNPKTVEKNPDFLTSHQSPNLAANPNLKLKVRPGRQRWPD